MERVPRIQVHSWDGVRAKYHASTEPYAPRTQSPEPLPLCDLSSYVPPESVSHLKKPKSDNGLRKGLWSKIKRSKSENDNNLRPAPPVITTRPDPQWAMSGVKMVWSADRQIWVFPKDEDDETTLQPGRTRRRREEQPPRESFHSSRSSNEYGDLLFGQVPGHYQLSPYGSMNESHPLPAYEQTGHHHDIARRTGTESQWTLVARRVSHSSSDPGKFA